MDAEAYYFHKCGGEEQSTEAFEGKSVVIGSNFHEKY